MDAAQLTEADVYVGGGIAFKRRAKLADGSFIKAFRDKGSVRPR